jgi:hypothetical protein
MRAMFNNVASAIAHAKIWSRRKQYFGIVFDLDAEGIRGLAAERVLAALRDYCLAEKPTVGASPEETYRMIGRRDVWLHIQDILKFDENTIKDLKEAHDEFFGE